MEDIILKIAINALPIMLAVILHEVAHGYIANRLGDPTARLSGRLTINPLPHIDPIGTIVIPGVLLILGSPFLFGWAKPVPINPFNLRNYRRDMGLIGASGPATNLILALASAICYRGIIHFYQAYPLESLLGILKPILLMAQASAAINLVLAIVNLIPIPPLDGGRVLAGLLPERQAAFLDKFEPYGMVVIVILMATNLFGVVVGPVFTVLFRLLLG